MDIDKLKIVLAVPHPVTGAYDAKDVIAAEQLNARNIVSVDEHHVTELGVLDAFENPKDGEALLQKLEAVSADPMLARALGWLKPGSPGLDMGNPTVRKLLDGYAETRVIKSAARDTLKSLAEHLVSAAGSLGHVKVGHIQEARR